jgi:hypothetical protein
VGDKLVELGIGGVNVRERAADRTGAVREKKSRPPRESPSRPARCTERRWLRARKVTSAFAPDLDEILAWPQEMIATLWPMPNFTEMF